MDELLHYSDDGEITTFAPRPAPSPGAAVSGLMVWAIDAAHRQNYLVPRDCPRVTFAPTVASSPADVARLMGPSAARAVVAIEAAWLARAWSAPLYEYRFDPAPFTVLDAGAGYWISRVAIAPLSCRRIAAPLVELTALGVELRVVPALWPLHDAVVASTLQFSSIRMRNAAAR